MKFTLVLILAVFFCTPSFAQQTEATQVEFEISSGYYSASSKQLVLTGPAATAIWEQMKIVEATRVWIGAEPSGFQKKSGMTKCYQSYIRPRPLARSVAVHTCSIDLEAVGLK